MWYFGHQSGIDFNYDPPVPLVDGATFTVEGSSSICTRNGKLLFYTDGETVWDKNHDTMPNGTGLLGDVKSSQSAMIIKKPKSNSEYYVFTIDEVIGSYGLRYSMVDMTLNSGLGAVTSQKNISILSSACEKMVLVENEDSTYWLVVHPFNSSSYHSYKVSSTGISPFPAKSTVGREITGNIANARGYLKANREGDMVAVAHSGLGVVELLFFHKGSGKLSNGIEINNLSIRSPYGVEFSHDGNYLYISESEHPGYIYQYDISDIDQFKILNSKQIIGSYPGVGGALQIGPDLRIYRAQYSSGYLGVIKYPDREGKDCEYDSLGFYLNGKKGWYGLPSYFNSILPEFNYRYEFNCLGIATEFELIYESVDSVYWDFGDPASGSDNFSNELNPSHTFTDTGKFTVTLVSYYEDVIDTLAKIITIYELPVIDIGNDTVLCRDDSVELQASYKDALIRWSDNSYGEDFIATDSGLYWAEAQLGSCEYSDSIHVYYFDSASYSLGNDTLACSEDTLILHLNNQNLNFLWMDSIYDSELTILDSGVYWVYIGDQNCSFSDTIHVSMQDCQFEFLLPNIFTPNGDGTNDILVPILEKGIRNFEIKFINRWGQKVFETQDSQINWSGKELPDGIYYWQMNATGNDDKSYQMNGYVNLMR